MYFKQHAVIIKNIINRIYEKYLLYHKNEVILIKNKDRENPQNNDVQLSIISLEIILPYRLTGPTGSTGPMSNTGINVTTNSMFANNTVGGTVSVVLGGTNIPLSNNQSLDSFAVNSANDLFTVPVTGRYYLSYQINTTTALLAGSRLILNGSTSLLGSILSPALSTSSYNNNLITILNAGNIFNYPVSYQLSI
jgi:hypothetical protein